MKRPSRWIGLITLAWLIGSCGGSEKFVAPPPGVASVTLSRDTATLVPAASVQLSAAAKTASGDALQRTFSWSTSDPAKATVSNAGVVAGVAPGTATITATADGKSGTATITVLDGGIISNAGGSLTLQSGAVQIVVPADALTSSTNLSVAASNAFAGDPRVVAGSVFDFGPPGTNFAKPVVIRIRYNPAVLPSATEEAALEIYLRTAIGWEVVPQSAADVSAKTVSAPVSHFSTYAVLTPEAVSAIAIGGATPLTVGQSEQLAATLTAADGRVLSNRVVTWSSSDATIAAINQTGVLAALKPGSVTVSAAAGGKTASVVVAISAVPPPPVANVTVSPPSASIIVGATQQLVATLKDANNNTLTGRAITWSSNNAAATVDANGLVTGVSAGGPVTITATSEGKSGTSSITVNPAPPPPVNTVTVSPPSASLVVGGTQQLTAVTKDVGGNVLNGRTITWSSSNTAVASVNGSGLVTAASAGGPVTITATSEGKTGTSSITVTAAAFTLSTSQFITSGLASPVFLTQPLNDGRIFVVEQPGRIRVVLNGVLQPTPFLDISSKLTSGGERGLLSVAFHPQYATNHFFYVYFTGLSGEIRVERFTTTSNPEVADPLSEKLIFTTPHASFANHNGGLVSFGIDGMLYAAFGDGGSGGDPLGNGQNYNAYLGGMIRIDIDHGDPYSVPADNPFVGQAGKLAELWAKGLRNPWRYAFDSPSGLLFIADVGQGLHEEVDAVPATQGGLNYGWNTMEGFSCYNATTCNQTGLQLPILDYGHAGACSITGGYVYRGSAMPAIQGHYFYSDYCGGWLRSLRYQNGVAVDQKDWGITFPGAAVTSFGQDAAGELYVISGNSIFKLVPGT